MQSGRGHLPDCVPRTRHGQRELVCAAVSVLMTTLAGYLENEAVNSKHKLTMGDCLVEMQTTDPAAIGAWRATVFGLMQLENSFPDYIQVTS